MKTIEFDAWENDAPLVTAGEREFSMWLYDAPVVEGKTDDEQEAGVGGRRTGIF